jgi:uncharacterized protein YpbB
MKQEQEINEIFNLASELVNKTNQNIFLTGKAGTGKTTFLKHIKSTTIKNTIVVAPTGVAAINAGGVTMHSFFQLPFGPYVPSSYGNNKFGNNQYEIADKNTLFKNIKFDKNKRKLIQELQLLIIDEISMVRADMLDAMDAILRQYRSQYHVPFGGVQVLFIGDMYQLPPVIKDQEWQILQDYYTSPFFFDAKVTSEFPPLYIELKKVYRQTDKQFIDILNRIRNNIPTTDDLEILNDFYKPHNDKENGILLTTHNQKASTINEQELYKLNGVAYTYKGAVEGDFNDKLLPNELELELKEGAQIMFIKNDSSGEKKYFNGKLATVKKLDNEKITVSFNDTQELYTLRKEVWRNIRYKLGADSQIEEDELGSYTQYPIRLAWAVTIHKSQGLTFDKVCIDAGKSFAAGQVYVALSRCTTMQGITLFSKIERSAISTDERIIKFARQEAKADELQRVLALEKDAYLANQLLSFFNFAKLKTAALSFKELVSTKKLPNQAEAEKLSIDINQKIDAVQDVAAKFTKELQILLHNKSDNLAERVRKAIHYFNDQLINGVLKPLNIHLHNLENASKVKQYVTATVELLTEMFGVVAKLNQCSYDNIEFNEYAHAVEKYNPKKVANVKASSNEEKIPSAQLTFQMYKDGKDAAQIAVIRNLAQSTIEGHLAQFVRSGAVSVFDLVPKEKVTIILKAIAVVGGRVTTPIKETLSDDCSHGDIRAVLNYKDWLDDQKEKPKQD